MNQIDAAKKGIITDEVKAAAKNEPLSAEEISKDVANGKTIICKSRIHDCKPVAIGRGLKIKINSNIGTSNKNLDVKKELEKLMVSEKYGADTVMDLSTGGNLPAIRKKMILESKIPLGTVPIYSVIAEQKDIMDVTEEDFLKAVKEHIDQGVDFVTVHCGLLKEHIPMLKSRIMGVVSRGGSYLVKWMLEHNKQNPLYTNYDQILEYAKEHDAVISLGDGLRPGCLSDATDEAQISELKILGDLAKRSLDCGVQVMVEGPGHVPLDQIEKNIRMQKEICNGAPFYVLGPLVTDISPGYDHLTGAIGGTLAAYYGADFLCYLTPKEHLGLPDVKEVIDGVVASKIAAHAADVARGIKGARDIDDEMSRARSDLDWEKMYQLSLNPEKARKMRDLDLDVCSMCGDACSAKLNKECRHKY